MSNEINWNEVVHQLESGLIRAANKDLDGNWSPNIAVKKAILELFKNSPIVNYTHPFEGCVDKSSLVPRFFTKEDGIRLVPGGSAVRRGSFVARGVVVMPPSYINIGAYIDSGSMVDSHVLVGSCAQIGKNVHLSAGVQIGGVLEPVGERPVIIEDNVFIGAQSVIVEGIIVREKAVIAPGVILSKGVSIYDTVNKKILPRGGEVPAGAVVIPGSRSLKDSFSQELGLSAQCPIIIKYRDQKSDSSLQLEELLRT